MTDDTAADASRPYAVENVSVLAQSDEMRFTELTLAPGQTIPWHIHSDVSDWHLCRAGRLRVETELGSAHNLEPGDMYEVPAGTAHRLVNAGKGPCRFVLVHGVGTYDFVALDGQRSPSFDP